CQVATTGCFEENKYTTGWSRSLVGTLCQLEKLLRLLVLAEAAMKGLWSWCKGPLGKAL
ncbi:hypothetical protein NDU88_001351, partial [Pleurodeles waltl]